MPKKETKSSEYFELPNPNLRAYFERVANGQPDEYRTPFYKGKSVVEILQQWMDICFSLPEVARWPSLIAFEKDLAKKVGPLSIMKPLSERRSDVDAYWSGVLLPSKPIRSEALRAVWSEWGKFGGLRMKSQENTVLDMKLSTNSGGPYFRKRRDVLTKTVPCKCFTMQERAFQITVGDMNSLADPYALATIQHLPQGKTFRACAIIGWRGQEGGPGVDDVKQRVVFMFPFAVNIQELQVYQPLITALQQPGGVPAWVSMDAVDEEITKLFDTKGADELIICTDFHRFDQHFNADMQDASKTLLTCFFGHDPYFRNYWLDNIFPVKYNIPLALSLDEIRVGAHGMGSGSGGTNADETLAHRALQHEVALINHSTLNPHSQCLGDDGILSYPGVTVDDVVKAYSAHGQEMNPDKQYASTTDCVYLRRWHHVNYRIDGICRGVYGTTRALGRLSEQERYYDPDIWGPEMVELRFLSIIENCKWHPAREQFAEFCMKGDKYRLGLDLPGFLDNIDKIAKKSIDVMPDFLGYTKSLGVKDPSKGIKDWWIVQYLLNKRDRSRKQSQA